MRYGVILAGGGGTRLWPASRRRRPKQLLPLLGGGESLLAATERRAARVSDQVLIVTAEDHAAAIREDLAGRPAEVLGEPVGRNTAAAAGLAAVHLRARDPDAVLGVLPADHHIADEDRFAEVAGRALSLASETGTIVVVGVVPARPETGFGYIEVGPGGGPSAGRGAGGADGGSGADDLEARPVVRFVEKPDRARAGTYAASGRHLWNAGMFFVRADRLLADLGRCLPDTARALAEIEAVLTQDGPDAARTRTAALYPALAPVSIDHGVLEHTGDLLCLAGDFGWNDVGSWTALADIAPHDEHGNAAVGRVVAVGGARGNIVAGDPDRLVALVGVEDLVVVQSGNAVLVVPRARAQDVREVVRALERAGLDPFL